MEFHEQIRVSCPKCGHTKFTAEEKLLEYDLDDYTDDEKFTCAKCKFVFTKADLISENEAEILEAENRLYAKALKELDKEKKQNKWAIIEYIIKEILKIILILAVSALFIAFLTSL